MKKVLSVLLIGLFGFTLTACGGDDTTSTAKDESNLLTYNNFTTENGAIKGWSTYSDASLFTAQSDGSVLVDADPCPSNSYEVRLASDIDNNTVTLESGKNYQISFMAKSTVARDIKVQVGEMLSTDPWFYMASADYFTVSLTTQLQKHTIEFTAFDPSSDQAIDWDNVCISIEMGQVGVFNIASEITLANVSIAEYDGAVEDKIAPTITQDKNFLYVATGKTYTHDDFVGLVTITDDTSAYTDLTITTRIVNAAGTVVTSVDGSVAGTYNVTYQAKDKANNLASQTFTVYVREQGAVAVGENLFNLSDEYAYNDEATSKLPENANKLVGWKESGYINFDSNTSDSFVASYGCSWAWYDPQIFLTSAAIDVADTYTLEMTVTLSEDRVITIDGQVYTFVAGVPQNITHSVAVSEGGTYTLCILMNEYDKAVSTNHDGSDSFVYPTITVTNLFLGKRA